MIGRSGWLLLAGALSAAQAVEPIPEAQQAARALQILREYRGEHPAVADKKLQVVYFTPSDRDPEPRWRERLEAILEDIRMFYRDGMERAGFGSLTFDLARDAESKWIVHLVKGDEPDEAYPRSAGGAQSKQSDTTTREKITRASRTALEAAGIAPERETVLVFCNLARWDASAATFRHHSPFVGNWTQTNGWCFAVDTVIQDFASLPKRQPMLHDAEWGNESLGKFNTIFIGGIAHELGHAFSLPHCGERWDENARGKSLMGVGNHTYREELREEGPGAFLTMASAMKLAGRTLFSKCAQESTVAPRLEKSELRLASVQPKGSPSRSETLRVEGTVKGTPPIYGVIAYFDSRHDGGYSAPTATSVPDAEGRFALEARALAPSPNAELRIEYCHVNGAISKDEAAFQVNPDDTIDLSQWELRKALAPLGRAVVHDGLADARTELERLEKNGAPELARTVGRKLVGTLEKAPKPSPAEVPGDVTQWPLGDAQPREAATGWLAPAANRVPSSPQIELPFLDAGRIYATGFFAHAPSRYVFDLGGKWEKLRGEGGLHTVHQPWGSVAFIIKADGREVFHSPVVQHATKTSYEVDVAGVKTLELLVDDGGDGKGNDWGLWLDPMLSRGTPRDAAGK